MSATAKALASKKKYLRKISKNCKHSNIALENPKFSQQRPKTCGNVKIFFGNFQYEKYF